MSTATVLEFPIRLKPKHGVPTERLGLELELKDKNYGSKPIEAILDTGTSFTTMSKSRLNQLGIPYELVGQTIQVKTASGHTVDQELAFVPLAFSRRRGNGARDTGSFVKLVCALTPVRLSRALVSLRDMRSMYAIDFIDSQPNDPVNVSGKLRLTERPDFRDHEKAHGAAFG